MSLLSPSPSLSRHFLPSLSSHSPSPNKNSTKNSRFLQSPPPPISLDPFTSSSLSMRSLLASWEPPKYVYPDPIPEFATAETHKFKAELRKKLLRSKETFSDDIDAVVMVCAEIFSEFLHKEYGGPGTLLVEPFTDMLLALKEKKLPGAPVAARAALLWAQNYVDKDWEIWNSQPSKMNTAGPSS